MRGLMMDDPLTVPAILRRAETYFPNNQVISEMADGQWRRHTYRELAERARKLAVALGKLGVKQGDRVATLCWNHHPHLEAYFGIPEAGAVVHTLNLRLHPSELAYIVNHADDKVLIVDDVLYSLYEQFKNDVKIQHVIVVRSDKPAIPGTIDYETLIAGTDASNFSPPKLDENEAAAMCYTSGTTGKPKGVVYSHRALMLHSMAMAMADAWALTRDDVVAPIVPMFHANVWGLAYASALVGAKQILFGPRLDPKAILDVLEREKATVTCGVPTIWLGVLADLDANLGKRDLSSVRMLVIAGSACPRALIEGFDRHNIKVIQLWGMTETTPLATICTLPAEMKNAPAEERFAYRAKQGVPVACLDIRARGDEGMVPWDGKTTGELEVRGPWVASAYYNNPETAGQFTEDGWFRTGDIVAIDARGCIQIHDRAKDVIKSGGEWISSVALENALMGHPAVAEAAVISVPHDKWAERPIAAVVKRPDVNVTADELIAYLAPQFAKWWLPDAVVFIEAIPRTSAGKFKKSALREMFKEFKLPN